MLLPTCCLQCVFAFNKVLPPVRVCLQQSVASNKVLPPTKCLPSTKCCLQCMFASNKVLPPTKCCLQCVFASNKVLPPVRVFCLKQSVASNACCLQCMLPAFSCFLCIASRVLPPTLCNWPTSSPLPVEKGKVTVLVTAAVTVMVTVMVTLLSPCTVTVIVTATKGSDYTDTDTGTKLFTRRFGALDRQLFAAAVFHNHPCPSSADHLCKKYDPLSRLLCQNDAYFESNPLVAFVG
eukprot:356360-Chlamydomonas_euryale.AAC.3